MLSLERMLHRFPPRTETAEAACMETCWRGYNGAPDSAMNPSTPLNGSFTVSPVAAAIGLARIEDANRQVRLVDRAT